MIPWKFLWNNIRLRPLRTLLTILSIAGGVAAVVAVLQSSAATRDQLSSLTGSLKSRVALEITGKNGDPFPLENIADAVDLPAIRAAVPLFRVFTKVVAPESAGANTSTTGEPGSADSADQNAVGASGNESGEGNEEKKNEIRGVALGVDLNQFHEIRDFTMASGQFCTVPGEACLESNVAERLGVKVGDEVRIGARGIPRMFPLKIVGILKLVGMGVVEETAVIFLPLADASRLGRASGKATAIQVVTNPDAGVDEVVEQLKVTLPSDLSVDRTTSAADMSQSTESMVNFSLNATAALSLIAAVFIVINTFQISVAERRRQLALLRIVGATVEQIQMSMYLEALGFAAAGTGLGVILGIIGSRVLSRGMMEAFGITGDPEFGIQPHAVIAGLFFGPLVTLVSIWYPARTSCDQPPLAVLRSALAPKRVFPFLRYSAAGAVCLLLSLLMFAFSYRNIVSELTSVLAIGLLPLSGLLWLPGIVRPGTSWVYRPVRRLFPVEAGIGKSQLLDNFWRTYLTVAVLFLVTSAGISVGNVTLSVTQDVGAWLDRSVTADFLLRASRPRIDMSESVEVSNDVEALLTGINGIEAIDRLTFLKATVNGEPVTFLARQLSDFPQMPLDLIEGDPEDVRAKVTAGQVVLGSVLARTLGVRPGDKVLIEVSGLSHQATVAGIARQYNSGGMILMMNRKAAAEVFPIRQIHAYGIRAADALRSKVGEQLRQLARDHGLIFQSMADLRSQVGRMINGITSRLWMILALALVIAAFGIVNTLTMNVIQQTRQLGVLRVIGMTRAQVIRMFLFQAFTTGVVSIAPGLVMGTFLAWLITTSFRSVADHGVVFSLQPLLLIGYLAGGVCLAVVSAVFPAVRAGCLKPLDAIHEE